MVKFETVGEPKRIMVNDANFFEVKKTRVVGSDNTFLAISKGFIRKDGSVTFTGGIGLPKEKEKVQEIIRAVEALLE